MHLRPSPIDPAEGQGCTTQQSGTLTQVAGTGASEARQTPSMWFVQLYRIGGRNTEELKDVSLQDNGMTHIQMWPRDYILERKSIIQVDCDREGRG